MSQTGPAKDRSGAQGSIGIYVHIPFCETRCPYCDFNTYSGIERLIPAYVDSLCEEISRWGVLLDGTAARTVFFGGGTPSYLGADQSGKITATLLETFPLEAGAEVTLEANPGDVTLAKAHSWIESGFNRVSMGVQSFDDTLLKTLGRRHSSAEARRSFQLLRESGFDNRSLDLMFGLPGQTIDHWSDSLRQALELEPDHVSLYGLQLEPGTPLEADVRLGRIARPDDDLAADMYELAKEVFGNAGFRHYEISNWSLPGRESRHNLLYWQNEPYLGVGPGAHSSLGGFRFANTRSPRWYMRSLGFEPDKDMLLTLAGSAAPVRPSSPDDAPSWLLKMTENGVVDSVERTTLQLELAETMMMGLRLDSGIASASFELRFGRKLREVFDLEIGELVTQGLLLEDIAGIRLSDRGRLLGNEVFGRFVDAAESADSLSL